MDRELSEMDGELSEGRGTLRGEGNSHKGAGEKLRRGIEAGIFLNEEIFGLPNLFQK